MTWTSLVFPLVGIVFCWAMRDANRAANRAEAAARRAAAAARAAARAAAEQPTTEQPDLVDQYTDPRLIGDDH